MNIFEELSKINVNEHTENKNGLTYLSWTWAWSEIKKHYPNATYEIEKFENNLPYVYDENTGYMVFTKMTIGEQTYEMWLPVMDGNNKSMLNRPYTYKVKEYGQDKKWTGKYVEKPVEAATMFDINKTIMRCLVKNIAMFGLGIYIYAGEDMPEGYEMSKEEARAIKITFGKHEGKTLGELVDKQDSYINYLFQKGSETMKSAITILTGIVDVPLEEQKDKLKEMPITEAQKQQIKDKYTADEIKEFLTDTVEKKKLSDLTYAEAELFLSEEGIEK